MLVLVVPVHMAVFTEEQPTGPADDTFAPQVKASAAAVESWFPFAGLTLEMKAAADSFLVRQMGRESYEQLVVFDPIRTDSSAVITQRRGRDHRYVCYWLVVPNDPDVAHKMYVGVWPDGRIRAPFAVPRCAWDPPECIFLDRKGAFAVAADAGLDSGLIPWRWSFMWSEAHGYFYEVRTVLKREGQWDVTEYMYIDANDGSVFHRAVSRLHYRLERDTPN